MLSLFTERGPGRPRSSGALDVLLLLASFAIIHKLYLGNLDLTSYRLKVMFAALFFGVVVFNAGGLYRLGRPSALHEEIGRVAGCWSLTVGAIGLFAFLSKAGEEVSRVWVGGSMVLALLFFVATRILYALLTRARRADGDARKRVALVGTSASARDVLSRLSKDPSSGYRIEAVFGDLMPGDEPLADGYLLAGGPDDVPEYVEKRRNEASPVDEVWLALPMSEHDLTTRLASSLRDSSVDVCIVPDTFGLQLLSGNLQRIAETAVVNVSDIRLPPQAEWFKRLFDVTVSSIALALLSPLLLGIALLVKLESPGPVLFRQRRYGIAGQEIEVWKFRSMRHESSAGDAGGRGEIRQATRGDSRVTRVGAILRRTSLDELPQFANVLQGSMSIVGPRPHAVAHNEQFRRRIDGYMMRHKIRPGITGWAQVNGWRGETDTLDKMEKRVQFDLDYIRHWSPWLDLKIMVLTLSNGFTGRNAY